MIMPELTKFQQRQLNSRSRSVIFLASLAIGLAASNLTLAQQGSGDPIESVNRAIFDVNLALDSYVLNPAARAYRYVTPSPVRTSVSNVLANLGAPMVAVNDLLQGRPEQASETIGRFMLNTIMGVGGIFDVAGGLGMPEPHSEDFGQTLATYGVPEGPYLMLPVFGPSNPRDLVGDVVAGVVNPVPSSMLVTASGTLAARERNLEAVEEFKRTSVDLYAATRTTVRQLRANEIRNGAPADIDDVYEDDLEDPEGNLGNDVD